MVDSWNDESFYENAFFTAPFKEVFLKDTRKTKPRKEETHSHIFKVKAPLLEVNEAVCISGNSPELGAWNTTEPVVLTKKGDWWTVGANISNDSLPVSYKYGIVNLETGAFVHFEAGDNRFLFDDNLENKTTVIHDSFIRLPNRFWKGAGLAIPVFSNHPASIFYS